MRSKGQTSVRSYALGHSFSRSATLRDLLVAGGRLSRHALSRTLLRRRSNNQHVSMDMLSRTVLRRRQREDLRLPLHHVQVHPSSSCFASRTGEQRSLQPFSARAGLNERLRGIADAMPGQPRPQASRSSVQCSRDVWISSKEPSSLRDLLIGAGSRVRSAESDELT